MPAKTSASPAIPTPDQIRAMPTTSLREFIRALRTSGLTVEPTRNRTRITTPAGVFIGSMPSAWHPTPQALMNNRAYIAAQIAKLHTGTPGTSRG